MGTAKAQTADGSTAEVMHGTAFAFWKGVHICFFLFTHFSLTVITIFFYSFEVQRKGKKNVFNNKMF